MFKRQQNARANMAPLAGQRVYSRLINGVQSHFVDLVITGTLTIAGGAADAIRNRGLLSACFDEIGIDENGTDRWVLHGRAARALSQQAAQHALPATALTSTAAAAYALRDVVRIYFAHPYAANPRETAFIEHDSRQVLQVFAKLAASGGADKLCKVSGAVTAVLSNLNVTVKHAYDAQETDKPYFIPIVRQIIAAVPAAAQAQQIFIKTSNALRAMLVSQEDTVVGEVTDILNGVVLRGDFRDIIGPSESKIQDLIDEQAYDVGGDMSSAAHLALNFQTHGRLANVLNPNQDINLRFELDVQPSVTGTGASQIRITTVELVADAQLCKPVDFPY